MTITKTQHRQLSLLQTKKILILGAGREGLSTYRFLRQQFPQKKLTLADQCLRSQLKSVWRRAFADDLYLNLSYFSTMSGWQEFISRPPEAFERWADGCTQECAEMEIILLLCLASQGKRVFVDTNIPLDWLREIADPKHVLIMLSPQETSVNRFFDRPDPEKQFLMRQIVAAPDSDAAKRNFLACIARINSRERYDALLHSGFQTLLRDDCHTKEETLLLVARCFGLI